MNTNKNTAFKVGLFVLLGATMALLMAIGLGGLTFEDDLVRYDVHFHEAISGLQPSSPVKYEGYSVGIVENIHIDAESLVPVVTIAIDPATPIREDTTAALVSQGITGIRLIELSRGSPSSPSIAPGSIIRDRPSTYAKLFEILDQVNQAVANLGELLGPANQELLVATVESLQGLLAEATGTLQRLSVEFAHTSRSARQTVEQVNDMLAENRETLQQTLSELQRASQQITGVLTEVQGLVTDHRGTVDASLTAARTSLENTAAITTRLSEQVDQLELDRLTEQLVSTLEESQRALTQAAQLLERTNGVLASNEANLGGLISDLRVAARSLRQLSQNLEESPGVLLRQPSPPREIPDD